MTEHAKDPRKDTSTKNSRPQTEAPREHDTKPERAGKTDQLPKDNSHSFQ